MGDKVIALQQHLIFSQGSAVTSVVNVYHKKYIIDPFINYF